MPAARLRESWRVRVSWAAAACVGTRTNVSAAVSGSSARARSMRCARYPARSGARSSRVCLGLACPERSVGSRGDPMLSRRVTCAPGAPWRPADPPARVDTTSAPLPPQTRPVAPHRRCSARPIRAATGRRCRRAPTRCGSARAWMPGPRAPSTFATVLLERASRFASGVIVFAGGPLIALTRSSGATASLKVLK